MNVTFNGCKLEVWGLLPDHWTDDVIKVIVAGRESIIVVAFHLRNFFLRATNEWPGTVYLIGR